MLTVKLCTVKRSTMFNLSTILYCFMVYKLSHLWDTKRLINNKPKKK